MTKNKALYAWFNNIMTFYRDTAVPEDAELPYGTYTYLADSWGGEQCALTINFGSERKAKPRRMKRHRPCPMQSDTEGPLSNAMKGISG